MTPPQMDPKATDRQPQSTTFGDLVRHLLTLQDGRKLIALAGAPGSGKTTTAAALCAALARAGRTAAVVPMDGFHLDNRILHDRGLLARKGSPASFDAAGFVAMIQRMRDGQEVVYPVFDRDRDIAVAGAAVLDRETEFVLVEGNYLLLREGPWAELRAAWDRSVWIDTPWDVLRARLLQRWLDHGLAPEQARARRDSNDLPNAETVYNRSFVADFILATDQE